MKNELLNQIKIGQKSEEKYKSYKEYSDRLKSEKKKLENEL